MLINVKQLIKSIAYYFEKSKINKLVISLNLLLLKGFGKRDYYTNQQVERCLNEISAKDRHRKIAMALFCDVNSSINLQKADVVKISRLYGVNILEGSRLLRDEILLTHQHLLNNDYDSNNSDSGEGD